MSGAVIDVQRIGKRYDRTLALKEITLCIGTGETLLLLGANGSGKTTLLKILAGAIAPSRGAGSLCGLNLIDQRDELRSLVGLVASESYLYDDLTGWENLRFVATMAGRQPSDAILASVLRRVDLVASCHDRVRGFSNGMKRRLCLARAFVLTPRLLLLDEPYNSLDVAGVQLVDDLVTETTAGEGVVVLATHDAALGLAIASRVAVLRRGTLSFSGSVADYRISEDSHVV